MIRFIEVPSFGDTTIRAVAVDNMPIGWVGKVEDFKRLKFCCPFDLDQLPPGSWLAMTEFIDDDDRRAPELPNSLQAHRRFYFGPSRNLALKKCLEIPD